MPPETVEVTPGLLRDWPLPSHQNGGGKQARGQVLVVGGAAQTPGAVLLAGVAALRAGAGKLAIATVSSTATALGVAMPEALVQGVAETEAGAISPSAAERIGHMAESARALLLGPGMTEDDDCCQLVGDLLRATSAPVVLDALGLAVVEKEPDLLRDRQAVLTPNPRELGFMLETDEDGIGSDPRSAVVDAAIKFGAVVSLGGTETWIAEPGGRVWHDTDGGVGLGVSGSGDCAAGVVAGLLARGATPEQAAVWGAHLHGSAGDRLATRVGRVGYLAREVADEIPLVLSMYD